MTETVHPDRYGQMLQEASFLRGPTC